MQICELDTPAVIIEQRILEANIFRMQSFADTHRVKLRPHGKTHKMPEIARLQLDTGAVGIAVAKLSEAEVMVRRGITDIQIANEIVGPLKIAKLADLSQKARITCAVDSYEGAAAISSHFAGHNLRLDILLEIDTGLHRCGVAHDSDFVQLFRSIAGLSGVNLMGIMTHAGHVYGAGSRQEVEEIGLREGSVMAGIASVLRESGIAVNEVSVGATPTVRFSGTVEGVTEIRPGNYVFNDMTQVALGTVDIQKCALTVLSSVISKPAADRVVIDAGSKTFALDKGAHGSDRVSGHGCILGKTADLARLSEEHGIIVHRGQSFALGEKLRIVPNHACPVINLFDFVYLVDGDSVIGKLDVSGRGKVL